MACRTPSRVIEIQVEEALDDFYIDHVDIVDILRIRRELCLTDVASLLILAELFHREIVSRGGRA